MADIEASADSIAREMFQHKWATCYAEHCGRAQGLIRQIIIWRDPIHSAFDQFLFESEGSRIENGLYDVNRAMRRSSLGSLVSSILGEAQAPVTPWSRIILQREIDGRVNARVVSLGEKPTYGEAPWDPPSDFDGTWGTLDLEGLHLSLPHEKCKAVSDLRLNIFLGASNNFWNGYLDIMAWEIKAQLWLHTPGAEYEIYKKKWFAAFPAMEKFSRKLVDVDAISHKMEPEKDGRTCKMSIVIPFDKEALCKNYPILASLFGLFQPLVLRFKKAGSTTTITVKDMTITSEWSSKDGLPAIQLEFDKDGNFVIDAEVDCKLAPAGDLFQIPFPRMVFQVVVSPAGRVRVTCKETSECPYEGLASFVFDIQLFRRFLTESFLLTLEPVKVGECGSAIQLFLRVCFPASSSSRLLKDWFRGFIEEQMKNADLMRALSDMLIALKSDIQASTKSGGGYDKADPPKTGYF